MGKDKSKKRHRSDSSSSYISDTSASEPEDAHNDKKEKKKHKKSTKDKSKRGSKSKVNEKSKDKDELVRQARAFLEQQLASGAAAAVAPSTEAGSLAFGLSVPAGSCPFPPVQVQKVPEQISEEDYFRRHAEFSTFLAEEWRIQFNGLSSEQSRELFSKFVEIWNEGRLEPRYYTGLVAAPKRRTDYRWNFSRMGTGTGSAAGGPPRGIDTGGPSGASGAGGLATGMAAFMEDQRALQADARQESRRQDRARARELLEELAPRETGREKMVTERAAQRELLRSRDDDGPAVGGFIPGGGRGGEDALLGGGDSLQEAKAREAQRAEAARKRGLVRVEKLSQRAATYAEKEEEKLAGLRALLAKGPITIAKRTT